MSITVDESAVKRINDLRNQQGKDTLMLRIIVEGGGCSGFQYKMELTDEIKDSDMRFEDTVVTDDISMPFLNGSTVSFKEELIGAEFVLDNPNAISGCGCGTSFAV